MKLPFLKVVEILTQKSNAQAARRQMVNRNNTFVAQGSVTGAAQMGRGCSGLPKKRASVTKTWE